MYTMTAMNLKDFRGGSMALDPPRWL